MDYGRCATESTHKKITAEENGRKLTLENPNGNTIRKIQVDGCLITDTSHKRCDYMFEMEETNSKLISLVIYLELKGCDIKKAYDQLVATIDQFNKAHQDIKKEAHIVASRVPKAGPEIQQLKIKMLKAQKATLTVSTGEAFTTV